MPSVEPSEATTTSIPARVVLGEQALDEAGDHPLLVVRGDTTATLGACCAFATRILRTAASAATKSG